MKRESTEYNETWSRIQKILDDNGITSVNAFAHQCGFKRAESLYQIRRGEYAISRNTADKILGRFPRYNRGWLITGEGAPLRSDAAEIRKEQDNLFRLTLTLTYDQIVQLRRQLDTICGREAAAAAEPGAEKE
ncbi:MAG: hypothetical protein J6K95_04145 [Rikenellaceae bacterium]|nr:hypothetical protein [Rikenellaceae bacterium]